VTDVPEGTRNAAVRICPRFFPDFNPTRGTDGVDGDRVIGLELKTLVGSRVHRSTPPMMETFDRAGSSEGVYIRLPGRQLRHPRQTTTPYSPLASTQTRAFRGVEMWAEQS
jgi:hypothetical protein